MKGVGLRAYDGHPLPLPPRELHTPLPQQRVVPLWQLGDEIMSVGSLGSLLDLIQRALPPLAIRDVVRDRAVEKVGLLEVVGLRV